VPAAPAREVDPSFVGPVAPNVGEAAAAVPAARTPVDPLVGPPTISQMASLSGPVAVALSGLPPVAHDAFAARAVASAAGSSPRPVRPGDPRTPAPMTPGSGGPIAGVDAGGSSGGGAGSSGSSSGGGMPPAVLLDPDSAPAAFALSVLSAPERRITWWYPEVVVGPG
jgi:hypothetical protein